MFVQIEQQKAEVTVSETSQIDLKAWQDSSLEKAKLAMRREGEIPSVAMIVVDEALIPEQLREAMKDIQEPKEDASGLSSVLVLDMSPTAENLFSVLIRCSVNQSVQLNLMAARNSAFLGGNEEPEKAVVAAFMKKSGSDVSDILAMSLKHMIHLTKALAFIKVDEIRMKNSTTGEEQEAIGSYLDAGSFQRYLVLPMIRNKKSGRVVDFGELIEMAGDDFHIYGKFAGLFPSSPSEPAPVEKPVEGTVFKQTPPVKEYKN